MNTNNDKYQFSSNILKVAYFLLVSLIFGIGIYLIVQGITQLMN
jgi:uncharacterized protein YqhQ